MLRTCPWAAKAWLLVVVLLAIAGCTGSPTPVVQPDPATSTGASATAEAGPTDAGAVGEPVVIAADDPDGIGWTAQYIDSDLGGCVVITDADGGERMGCGFEVPGRHDIGSVVLDSEAGQIVAGPVSEATATVRILSDGQAELVEVTPVSDPGLPSPHYAVQLPQTSTAAGVVAVDAVGEMLEERPIGGG